MCIPRLTQNECIAALALETGGERRTPVVSLSTANVCCLIVLAASRHSDGHFVERLHGQPVQWLNWHHVKRDQWNNQRCRHNGDVWHHFFRHDGQFLKRHDWHHLNWYDGHLWLHVHGFNWHVGQRHKQ